MVDGQLVSWSVGQLVNGSIGLLVSWQVSWGIRGWLLAAEGGPHEPWKRAPDQSDDAAETRVVKG